MSGRTASPDTASVTVPGSGDRTPELRPTPDGSPLLASIRCWTSRASKAPHRTHAVTIDASWQVTVPHDLESERLAVALGGYLSCLELAMWRRSWAEFIPFLGFPVEVCKLNYTTNGIESLNARFRPATRRRGHFPDEQSALKVLYLAVRERQLNRPNPTGQISGWKNILNVLSRTCGDRMGIN